MNIFIVMQGETYHEERNAGVLWTPQIDKSGMVPHFWNRMKELKKGDRVFHYVKGQIVAISLIKEDCREGRVSIGGEEAFIAKADYQELDYPLPIRENFTAIKPMLPVKYAPFQEDASGNSGYLYPCNEELALCLLELINSLNFYGLAEEQLELAIEVVRRTRYNPMMTLIAEMELEIKTKMRRGKEQFQNALKPLWRNACPLCGIAIEEVLTANYAKPWKDSTDAERLDPYNGILLCANHSALFKAGLIAFTGGGSLRISSRIPEEDSKIYELSKSMKIPVSKEHASYFRWHKRNVFVEPRLIKLMKTSENLKID